MHTFVRLFPDICLLYRSWWQALIDLDILFALNNVLLIDMKHLCWVTARSPWPSWFVEFDRNSSALSQHVSLSYKDKNQSAVRKSCGRRIAQAMRENWKANGAPRVDNCSIWCHSSSLSGLGGRLIDFISSAIHLCIHTWRFFCFKFRCSDSKGDARWPRVHGLLFPVIVVITLFTVHLTNSLSDEAYIRDWNRLPLSRFDWSSSSQGASSFKRRFVACRHSSIEQKHAHVDDDAGLMNNTLMRETTPAVRRSLVSLNCSTSLFPTWRAPATFEKRNVFSEVNVQKILSELRTGQRAEDACGVLILLSLSLTIQHQCTGQSRRANTTIWHYIIDISVCVCMCVCETCITDRWRRRNTNTDGIFSFVLLFLFSSADVGDDRSKRSHIVLSIH